MRFSDMTQEGAERSWSPQLRAPQLEPVALALFDHAMALLVEPALHRCGGWTSLCDILMINVAQTSGYGY